MILKEANIFLSFSFFFLAKVKLFLQHRNHVSMMKITYVVYTFAVGVSLGVSGKLWAFFSTMGKAINYYRNRKSGFHLFLYDETVPIDNNMAERKQRCPVMGRKNFNCFKSINGADVGTFFYSLVESCKSNGLNPISYINDMAHRSSKGEALESPFHYASRINEMLRTQISKELSALSKPSG